VDLTDKQWNAIAQFFPPQELKPPGDKGGRPWRDPRDVVNGVLWILRTGAPWADMPRRYPPYQTCHRRFQTWIESGVLHQALVGLAEDMRERGKVDLSEAYIDGSHAGAKRGVLMLGSLAAAKRPRSWQWQTAMAFLSRPGLQAVSELKSTSSPTRSTSASPKKLRRS
jgi:transposase